MVARDGQSSSLTALSHHQFYISTLSWRVRYEGKGGLWSEIFSDKTRGVVRAKQGYC